MHGPLPLTFRHTTAAAVMAAVDAGESVSLVGAASTGKSNFMAFLCRDDVRRHHLGDSAAAFVFALVDSHSLAADGPLEWRVYELVLHRLLQQGEPLGLDAERLEFFGRLYESVVTQRDALLGQRYLEWLLEALCGPGGRRVALLFDQFDEIYRDCDRSFLLNLRSIRDRHKYALLYVAASRDDLAHLRADHHDVEAFYELLSLNTIGLRPYDEPDTRTMLQRMAARRGVEAPPDPAASELYALSGGHPGVLRALYWAWADGVTPPGDGDAAEWLNQPAVWEEFTKIWRGLGEDERAFLVTLAAAAGAAPSRRASDASRRLDLKGLIVSDLGHGARMFCPLLRAFVHRRQLLGDGGGVRVDRERRLVWVGDHLAPSLTQLEFDLLACLAEQPERVFDRDELANRLYPKDTSATGDGVQDNRIDTLVGRLRKKIEPDPENPHHVVTVRGKGYKLVEPDSV